MCSPELAKGTCCICFGALLPDNTLYDDLREGRGGVHKGLCAIHAGFYPDEHADRFNKLLDDYHAAPRNTPEKEALLRRYYQMASEVAEENHDADDVEKKFQALAARWHQETAHMSSLHDMCLRNDAYQQIIAMGWDAVKGAADKWIEWWFNRGT